jgi:hypothetical protein
MNDTVNIHTSATDTGFEYAKAYGLHHKKRFSWQPVAAGIAAALAVQVVLGLIGLGVGFAVNPTPNTLPWHETPTIGALMWAGVSLLTAMFYGGFIAARLTKSTCHHEGVLSGIVTWAGTVLVILFLLANSYGSFLGGASQIMGHLVGPHFGYGRFVPGPHVMGPPLPGAPVNAETLNQSELANPPPADLTRATEEREATAKAALAAGVVLLLAAFTSAVGGVLGAAHVRHHRAHEMLEAKGLV